MDVTEVTLGADAQQKPTIINETKVENANKNKVIFGVIGAVVGFAYCKYKKHDNTKTGTYTIAGAAVGVGLAYLYDMGRNKITIKAPKK